MDQVHDHEVVHAGGPGRRRWSMDDCPSFVYVLLLQYKTQILIAFFGMIYSVFEGELADVIPVVRASVAGCRIIGRLCVGMSHYAIKRTAE